EALMRLRTSETESVDALKVISTPLILNLPWPLESLTATAKLAEARGALVLIVPNAAELVTVAAPLLKSRVAGRKWPVYVALPRTISLLWALENVILSVVAS